MGFLVSMVKEQEMNKNQVQLFIFWFFKKFINFIKMNCKIKNQLIYTHQLILKQLILTQSNQPNYTLKNGLQTLSKQSKFIIFIKFLLWKNQTNPFRFRKMYQNQQKNIISTSTSAEFKTIKNKPQEYQHSKIATLCSFFFPQNKTQDKPAEVTNYSTENKNMENKDEQTKALADHLRMIYHDIISVQNLNSSKQAPPQKMKKELLKKINNMHDYITGIFQDCLQLQFSQLQKLQKKLQTGFSAKNQNPKLQIKDQFQYKIQKDFHTYVALNGLSSSVLQQDTVTAKYTKVSRPVNKLKKYFEQKKSAIKGYSFLLIMRAIYELIQIDLTQNRTYEFQKLSQQSQFIRQFKSKLKQKQEQHKSNKSQDNKLKNYSNLYVVTFSLFKKIIQLLGVLACRDHRIDMLNSGIDVETCFSWNYSSPNNNTSSKDSYSQSKNFNEASYLKELFQKMTQQLQTKTQSQTNIKYPLELTDLFLNIGKVLENSDNNQTEISNRYFDSIMGYKPNLQFQIDKSQEAQSQPAVDKGQSQPAVYKNQRDERRQQIIEEQLEILQNEQIMNKLSDLEVQNKEEVQKINNKIQLKQAMNFSFNAIINKSSLLSRCIQYYEESIRKLNKIQEIKVRQVKARQRQEIEQIKNDATIISQYQIKFLIDKIKNGNTQYLKGEQNKCYRKTRELQNIHQYLSRRMSEDFLQLQYQYYRDLCCKQVIEQFHEKRQNTKNEIIKNYLNLNHIINVKRYIILKTYCIKKTQISYKNKQKLTAQQQEITKELQSKTEHNTQEQIKQISQLQKIQQLQKQNMLQFKKSIRDSNNEIRNLIEKTEVDFQESIKKIHQFNKIDYMHLYDTPMKQIQFNQMKEHIESFITQTIIKQQKKMLSSKNQINEPTQIQIQTKHKFSMILSQILNLMRNSSHNLYFKKYKNLVNNKINVKKISEKELQQFNQYEQKEMQTLYQNLQPYFSSLNNFIQNTSLKNMYCLLKNTNLNLSINQNIDLFTPQQITDVKEPMNDAEKLQKFNYQIQQVKNDCQKIQNQIKRQNEKQQKNKDKQCELKMKKLLQDRCIKLEQIYLVEKYIKYLEIMLIELKIKLKEKNSDKEKLISIMKQEQQKLRQEEQRLKGTQNQPHSSIQENEPKIKEK